jgi:hypothetical protein
MALDGKMAERGGPIRVFISYRRDDTEGYAGRLYDSLVPRFGERNVFVDIDSIDPGTDYAKTIRDTVGACDVLLALIGPNWLTTTGEDGKPRLHAQGDWVRREIQAALRLGVAVIPVLVRDAEMPARTQLPRGISRLAAMQAFEIGPRWRADVARLIEAIEAAAATARAAKAPATKSPAATAPPQHALVLSRRVVDVGEVPPHHVLQEQVSVQGTRDWTAETTAEWIDVQRHDDSLSLVLRPGPGANRGYVLVRDRASGASDSVTVLAHGVSPVVAPAEQPPAATPAPPAPPPPPPPRAPAPPPRAPAPPTPAVNRGPLVIGGVAAVAVLLGVVGFLLFGGDDGGDDLVDASVTVPGRATWTDTGVDVQQGATITISVTGQITHDVHFPDQSAKLTGPEGTAGTADDPTYKSVILSTNHGAVIARIGSDGDPAPIGRERTFEASRDGRLFVGVNDAEPCNNGGEFTVKVRVPEGKSSNNGQPPPTTVPIC